MFSSSFSYTRTTGKSAARVFAAKKRFLPELRDLLEKCTIEQDDALKVLSRFDTPTAFHFVDPPYVGSDMGHYTGMFNEDDLNRLLETLSGIKGKFMLTMYPHDLIREYAGRVGWTIRPVQRTVTASNTKRRKQEEWMITNY